MMRSQGALRFRGGLSVGINLIAVGVAAAVCPVIDWSDYGEKGVITDIAIEEPGSHSGDLEIAMNTWNDCDGANQGLAPSLIFAGGTPDISVRINSSGHPDGITCGQYDPNGGSHGSDGKGYTGSIEIWTGTDNCGSVQSVFLHELGHILGLDHFFDAGNCLGYIMNNNSTTIVPAGAECDWVESTWLHPDETDGSGDPDPNTPLVLDLGQPGIVTSNVERSPVVFDIDGDGVVEHTGWLLAPSGDHFLWMDLNKNRAVDSAEELFGSASTVPDGSDAVHGFEALAAYDDPRFGGNGDGAITHEDRVWSRLRLWHDENQDGLSSRDEISRLRQKGILGIDLSFSVVEELDGAGNWRILRGAFWVRGFGGVPEPRTIEDIGFRTEERR